MEATQQAFKTDYEPALVAPFPYGESPYGIKGIAFRGHFEHFDADVPGGRRAVFAAAKERDPELGKWTDQPIVTSSFYDIFTLPLLDGIAADLAGRHFAEFVEQGARHQAQRDMRGVYKIILRVFSPVTVMERICRVVGMYFNFGPAHVAQVRENAATLVRVKVPVLLLPWYRPVAEGYMKVAIERTGAKNAQIVTTCEDTEVDSAGVQLGTVSFRCTWE